MAGGDSGDAERRTSRGWSAGGRSPSPLRVRSGRGLISVLPPFSIACSRAVRSPFLRSGASWGGRRTRRRERPTGVMGLTLQREKDGKVNALHNFILFYYVVWFVLHFRVDVCGIFFVIKGSFQTIKH